MACHRQSSLQRKRRINRWESRDVKCVPAPVDPREWQYILETLAKELYDLSYQLQDNPRSHSLPRPGEQLKPLTLAQAAGENGAWNGKDSLKLAA